MSGEPRVAYDASFCLGNYRGMGRYLRTLIADREQRLLGFCKMGKRDPRLRLVAEGSLPYPLWEQIEIPRLVRRHGIDVFLAPYNTAPLMLPRRTRLALVVHDLIFMEPIPFSRSLYQNAGRFYRRWVTPRAVRRADLLLTVSDFTAQQLAARFGADLRQIRVIPPSIAADWYASAEPAPHDYVLAVSGEAPNKNLDRALQAFALCRLRGHATLRMKIAGVQPAFHAAFQYVAAELGIGSAVEFLPYVSEQEMRRIYRHAVVVLVPSLAEGFGIPLLEAMASGIPVVSSDATSLPEVGGDAALYCDPTSIEQMAEKLHQTLDNAALRARMSERGRAQARRFHPDAVRASIRRFWEELAQAAEPNRGRFPFHAEQASVFSSHSLDDPSH